MAAQRRPGGDRGVVAKLSALEGVVVGVGVVAVAPLTWWVAGAIPDEIPVDRRRYADYAVRPPSLSESQTLAIGLVSLVAVLGGLAVLIDGVGSGRIRREWLGVLAPCAAVAAYLGVGYRIATMAVHGANIGFGLMVLGSFAVVPVLGGIALVRAWHLTTDRARSKRGRGRRRS